MRKTLKFVKAALLDYAIPGTSCKTALGVIAPRWSKLVWMKLSFFTMALYGAVF